LCDPRKIPNAETIQQFGTPQLAFAQTERALDGVGGRW